MTADALWIRFRPMRGWDGPLTDPRASGAAFSAELYKTERLLLTEARQLGASDVIVEVDAPAGDFLADGTGMKSGRREPEFPGVVVHLIGTRHGDLRYACDAFEARYSNDLPGWQCNLRAVALGLEALRKPERYGIASRGEQYRGFAALPPGTPLGSRAAPEALTLDGAARLLAAGMDGLDAGDLLDDRSAAVTAYRVAAKRVHPDNAHTGNAESFRRVNEAWALLEAHHDGANA